MADDPRRADEARRFPTRLRNRIVVRIGVLVAVLATVLGASTYAIVRDALVHEQELSAREQFETNTAVLAGALRVGDVDEVVLLASLRPEVRARELLFTDGRWFAASLQLQPDDLPDTLVTSVRDGRASVQRFPTDSGLQLGLGTPLGEEAMYFEVFSLANLGNTLGTLRRALIASGLAATLVGALWGWLIARRVTSPLEGVADAATQIASGDLDVRMAGSDDRDLGRIAASFNRMADSLQARISRESRFAADVSHELRSPMTTLVNATTVLERRRSQLSADGQEALTLLAGDVDRLQRLIADLTEMSKHDAGGIRPDSEVLEAGTAVAYALRRTSHEDVQIDVSSDAVSARVLIDPLRLERVFATIADNAAAYAGGLSRVCVDADERTVRIHLEDRGPGVPEQERERIFERFSRGVHGERRGTADGSGLGLSLALENMRILDGTISAGGAAEGGARFTLELPRVDR
ncbi:MAG: ATP-binding protein [Acidimicrobiales bacterium]